MKIKYKTFISDPTSSRTQMATVLRGSVVGIGCIFTRWQFSKIWLATSSKMLRPSVWICFYATVMRYAWDMRFREFFIFRYFVQFFFRFIYFIWWISCIRQTGGCWRCHIICGWSSWKQSWFSYRVSRLSDTHGIEVSRIIKRTLSDAFSNFAYIIFWLNSL